MGEREGVRDEEAQTDSEEGPDERDEEDVYICYSSMQLTINQVSDGVSYSGTIICPSCLEICYVSLIIISHYLTSK